MPWRVISRMGASFCFSTGSSWRSCRNPTARPPKVPQQIPGGCWLVWKVQLPLEERRLEHKRTGRPSSPRQDCGCQRPQDSLEALDTNIPPLFPPLLLRPQDICSGRCGCAWLRMAAKEDMNSDGQPISDRTDPVRNDGLPLPFTAPGCARGGVGT